MFQSNNQQGPGRLVLNVALTGALAYLTLTGKLGWLLDAFISLWLFFLLAPLVALVAYFWFIEKDVISGDCPNCGNEFQVFKFAVKDEVQLCPYCSQPFKVDDRIFIRDGVRRSYFNQGNVNDTECGVIVDVEAEVLDD